MVVSGEGENNTIGDSKQYENEKHVHISCLQNVQMLSWISNCR